MNILLIVSWYKDENSATTGSFFEEQARALKNRGHKVTILCVRFIPFSSKGKTFFKKYDDYGLPTCTLKIKGIVPKSRYLNYKYLKFKSYKIISKQLDLSSFDLIHAHTFQFAGIVTEFISNKINIPYVITEHYTQLVVKNGINHSVDLNMARRVYNNSQKNFVVSTSFREDLIKKIDLKSSDFEVLHNMVNPIFFETKALKNEEKFMFAASYLLKRKNIPLLINSFLIIQKSFPDLKFFIAGDGPERESLLNLVKELGLSSSVVFLGELSREQIAWYMKACELFVHSSLYETFGVVLIESLASGKPFVALNSRGPIDIVNDFNGILVDEINPKSFAAAIKTVLERSNDSERISKDCYNRFSEETIVNVLEKTYNEVLAIR